jgi:hypothetical protein
MKSENSDGMIALAKYAGLEVLHVSTNLALERQIIGMTNGKIVCLSQKNQ